MKAKILLLALAMLLLGACQSENEPTEAFYLLQKSESMEERNEFVTNTTAAMIQITDLYFFSFISYSFLSCIFILFLRGRKLPAILWIPYLDTLHEVRGELTAE